MNTRKGVLDNIILEGEYKFSVYMTIDYPKSHGGEYDLTIEFRHANLESFDKAAQLYNKPTALKISSDIITKEKLNITQIVARDFSGDSTLAMKWVCKSDTPFSLLDIE